MTPLFPAQRAAEEFDRVLAGTAGDTAASRYAELLDAVEQLRALPEVTPRAEFVGDLRARLMTAAETELVAGPRAVRPATSTTRVPDVRTRRRRLGTVAASLVIVGGSAGMAAAATGALPGQPLYPVKRGVENAETALRFNEASQGRALLGQAATRLDEVRALQAQGSADPDVLAQTMDDFTSAANDGSGKLFASYESSGNQADIAAVRDFASTQMATLATMSTGSDTATNDLLRDAADALATIDEQARGLCGSCGSAQALALPSNVVSAAGAASMDNLIARPVSQARADIAAAQAARQAHLAALQQQAGLAEQQASAIPQVGVGGTQSGAGSGRAGGAAPSASSGVLSGVTSALTSDGKLVPTVSTGAAVNDLVTSVTGSVDQTTGGATTPVTKPLTDSVEKLTGSVDDTVNGLLP